MQLVQRPNHGAARVQVVHLHAEAAFQYDPGGAPRGDDARAQEKRAAGFHRGADELALGVAVQVEFEK